ncbi:A24 family peptidase [Desulfuribacillus alkaliarsenatis]|uniref:Prepilin type IV endopeptidase peptidase domain-containing protein n=1 Tax=Desulfuribacillus alkaliarsenatis TaxID=766136 RepID=A0A1E5G093_9FIRM|nr:prepilin peptidase [Desulfuribacillus alkaliarsenatis]OEF96200.1 hypothetical protein BHF68_08510 [Desulfuribacillus alkaliarsenatis]
MWLNAVLIITLVICVVTDIRSRKIYNKVLLPALIITLIIHIVMTGWEGLTFALMGLFTGLLILIIPYMMGGIGAGDVKLLALIGAIKGVSFVINTALFMAIFGAIIAIMIMLFRKGFVQRLKAIGYFIGSLRLGLKTPIWVNRKNHQLTYPYGVAIALGAIISLFGNGWF